MMFWRWLQKFHYRSRQGCMLVGVAAFIWILTTYSINSMAAVNRGRKQIKSDVNNPSKNLLRFSARENDGVINASHASRLAANDLEKTMVVLLEKILERLDKVEHRLNISATAKVSSILSIPEIPKEEHTFLAQDLIIENQEQCSLKDKEKQQYPKCQGKIQWMTQIWKTDPCYASYGVDGSVCSFIMYLSEIEEWCPKSAWHGSNFIPKQYIFGMQSTNRTKGLDGLMELLKDPNERHPYAWIRMRIKRMWPRWQAAIQNFTRKQDLSKRRPKKILVHMGLLSKKSGFNFAELQFKGGPLGELVQWSDLIASLYVLGHQLTITSEADQLSSIISQFGPAKSHCQIRRRLPVDLIYIDIIGLKLFKTYLRNTYSSFSCLLRIVDTFGTEPAFILQSFAKQRGKMTYMAVHELMPKQFFNMFPHTPDNSFMGFVVDRHLNESNVKDIERSNMAVVYGKNEYMWKGKEDYLNTVNKSGIVIHGTVYQENKTAKVKHIPDYVINHGVLNGEDLHTLLRQSKIFLGLGFPYEGPAPLEAIANGAVFINSKFEKPHNRYNTLFFRGKPTEREVTSQHPYAEQFIGEPYVYTININDSEEVRTTIQKILDTDHFKGYLPYEYTEEGFIQRTDAYIEHQNFCKSQKQFTKWPPESAVQILFGEAGKSCKDLCWEKNLICEPSHFLQTNTHNALIIHGASCIANKNLTDIYYPALDTKTNDCIIQQEELLFSCVGKQENLRRLCPCRNYIKEQTALCRGCET